MAERDSDHLFCRRHFEIERQVDLFAETVDVFVADVAAVFAQVRRDAVGTRGGGELRRTHGIGVAAAARVADGRHVVDVHAEAEFVGHEAYPLASPPPLRGGSGSGVR